MQDTITVAGQILTAQPITVEQADEIFAIKDDPRSLNRALVDATFQIKIEKMLYRDIKDLFQQMLDIAVDVNGMRAKGETPATGSTSASSSPG